MKKFSLLLCCFVALLVSQRMWAEPTTISESNPTITVEGGVLTITSSTAESLKSYMQNLNSTASSGSTQEERTEASSKLSAMKNCTSIVLSGEFNADDLSEISTLKGFSYVTTVDMSQAKFAKTYSDSYVPSSYVRYASSLPSSATTGSFAVLGGTVCQWSFAREWKLLDYVPGTFTDYTEEQLADILNTATLYTNARVSEDKYCQLHITGTTISGPIIANNNISFTAVYTTSDIGESVESIMSSLTDGQTACFTRYYKWVQKTPGDPSTNEWQICDEEYYNDADGTRGVDERIQCPTNADLNHLDAITYGHAGSVMRVWVYYTKSVSKTWVDETTENNHSGQSVVDASFTYNDRWGHLGEYHTDGQWVKMTDYEYYQLTFDAGSWKEVTSPTDPINVDYYFADIPARDAKTDASDGQYAVVGGTKNVYNGSGWVLPSTDVKVYDYSDMKFTYWSSSIQTAYLSNYAAISDCPVDAVQGCTSLITLNHNSFSATQGAATTTDGLTTVPVTSTEPGLFNLFYRSRSYNDGYVFKFQTGSNLNADDLVVLTSESTKHYYVDLYAISTAKATDAMESSIETAIRGAIDVLRENNTYFRGLVLPENPNTVGTTLIMDRTEDSSSPQATCSEFIVYKNQSATTMHVYDEGPSHLEYYNTKFNTMKKVISATSIESGTTTYLFTTNYDPSQNNNNWIDVSSLRTATHPRATITLVVNNEMVNPNSTAKAEARIEPVELSGRFDDAVKKTGVGDTRRLDILRFVKHGSTEAPIDDNDITAINDLHYGPRVLDLSQVNRSEVTQQRLNMLTNPEIEYIILPAGKDKSIVHDYTQLPNLKAVISTNDEDDTDHDLVAYVKVAGSLPEARKLATGFNGSSFETSNPKKVNLTSVTLSGNLNSNDIALKEWDVHGTGSINLGLHDETGIKTIDLEDASFANYTDMNFYKLGLTDQAHPEVVKIPKNGTVIPEECFSHLQTLTDGLHIPYSYTTFEKKAFYESNLSHITTEDANGALIDNGPESFTFSANLKSIDTDCFYLQGQKVRDIYVLASEAPFCAKDAFRNGMCYGNGGYGAGAGVYCRDLYIKNDLKIVVLHIPQGLTPAQKDKYTDTTKEYTKRDQTGAVDADGNPLYWPTRKEMIRAYNQASDGKTWNDWHKDPDAQGEINDIEVTTGTLDGRTYDFPGYEGWHQITLCMTSYVAPTEDVVNNKIERIYQEDGWYTFCIPFDMTEDEVIEYLGVPASTSTTNNYLGSKSTKVTSAIMPELYTLQAVTRSMTGSNGTVTITLSRDLAVKRNAAGIKDLNNTGSSDYEYRYYNPTLPTDNYEVNRAGIVEMSSDEATEANKRNGKIVIRGGYPYFIKAYKRYGETVNNLGERVMLRNEFKKIASSVYRTGCYKTLGGKYTPVGGSEQTSYTSNFAIPYEGHLVQAGFSKEGASGDAFYMDNGTKVLYKYRFMGQYWQQDLPVGSYYVAGGRWYYYPKKKDGYYWKRYHSIINVSSSLDDVNTEYYRQIGKDSDGGAIFDGNMKLVYKDAHDDSFVVNENVDTTPTSPSGEARSIRIVFDDVVTEYDADGNEVTAVDMLDGEYIAPLSNSKIYNLKGQYVGNSLEGLQRGLYIVNGKKIVID